MSILVQNSFSYIISLQNFGNDTAVVSCCSSENYQYGEKGLGPQSSFGFSYKPTKPNSSVSCSVTYMEKKKKFNVFGGKAPRNNNRWRIKDDGIYLLTQKVYQW
jgi:hypothetical protein